MIGEDVIKRRNVLLSRPQRKENKNLIMKIWFHSLESSRASSTKIEIQENKNVPIKRAPNRCVSNVDSLDSQS